MSAGNAKREVVQSLLCRVGGMGLGFVATAVLIRELGASSYGTWAALTSLLAWVQLSDFGVGYALKNRIASAAKPEELLRLVSGVFQFYALVAIFVVMVFLLFGHALAIVKDYRAESFLLYGGTIIFFPLTIGSAVLQGMRKNSISSLMNLMQSIFWLSCIMLLVWKGASLLQLSLLNVTLVLIMGIGQCALGAKAMVGSVGKAVIELLNFTNMRLAFPLLGIGIRFILLQLSGVILFSLGTYLTYSNLSAADAAKYDVLFKLFQVPLTFFNVVISVYWVEIARSIALKDGVALRKKFVQLQLMALGVSLLMLFFSLVIASPLVDVYSGGKIHASQHEILAFWVLIVVQIFAYAGAVFLNAAENLHGQIVFSSIAAALLIPTVLFFYSRGGGFSAVPLATAAWLVPSLCYCNWAAYQHVIKKHR